MNDSKRPFVSNLESAKAWIHQAEQSFGQDADIRGELNLLLAQAELQRVREANRARQWRWKYPLLRHSLAFALALLAMVGGFYLWDNKTTIQPQPIQQTQQTGTTVQLTAAPPSAIQPQPIQQTQQTGTTVQLTAAPPSAIQPQPIQQMQQTGTTVQLTAAPPSAVQPQPSQRENVPANRDHEIQLSHDEMQKLIRAAGKSLRGQ